MIALDYIHILIATAKLQKKGKREKELVKFNHFGQKLEASQGLQGFKAYSTFHRVNHGVGSPDHFQDPAVMTMIHYCFHSHFIYPDK